MKQLTLAGGTGFEKHARPTRKGEFLARMEALVPWAEFCALIEPHYPKAGNGRPPVGLERMLRMYFIANWFNLADEACEDALHDVPVFRAFCRIDLGRERVPDATTLLNFRHLLEQHQLGAAMFAKVGELLLANGMKLSGGTIVDATLIAAPPSVKNAERVRCRATSSVPPDGSSANTPWRRAGIGASHRPAGADFCGAYLKNFASARPNRPSSCWSRVSAFMLACTSAT